MHSLTDTPERIAPQAFTAFPRYFRFGTARVNSYKVFLIVGLYVGTLATAGVAESAGESPLLAGVAAMSSGLLGLIGARVYHLLIHARHYFSPATRHLVWDVESGGWGVFGSLMTFVPASYLASRAIGVSAPQLWDFMSAGVLTGGFWIRLGCVFNGCCVGRETSARFGVWLHDTRGVRKRRVPVQYLEMGWWALGAAAFAAIWPAPLPPGSCALGVLAWYGAGRFVLEPLREDQEIVFGRIKINQLVAATLAIVAGGTLVFRLLNR